MEYPPPLYLQLPLQLGNTIPQAALAGLSSLNMSANFLPGPLLPVNTGHVTSLLPPHVSPSVYLSNISMQTAPGDNALMSAVTPKSTSILDLMNISPNKRKTSNEDGKTEVKKAKIETRALKAKRPGFTDERYNETSYFYENGLRKVVPYYFTFTTFTKGRWVGETILKVFSREFRAQPQCEYERCINAGTLTVNFEKVSPDYKLKHNDLLANIVHRHEVPVSDKHIQVVTMTEDLVVVDKPPSIPVHPCGRYRHNTVVFILAKEQGLKNLRTIHRLDRLTSGLLLFGRNPAKAREIETQIRSRQVRKEYIARVEGEFPMGVIQCRERIEVISYKIGVCRVSDAGKDCHTEFQRISFNGSSSIVLCRPYTGRMHQIRVHLQYLGHPVLNDPLYNHPVFGPAKGKAGDIGKTEEQLIADLIEIHSSENWLGDDTETSPAEMTSLDQDLMKIKKSVDIPPQDIATEDDQDEPDDGSKKGDPHCYECRVKYRDPSEKDLIMYLHALRYQGKDWSYETELPPWADANWSGHLHQ